MFLLQEIQRAREEKLVKSLLDKIEKYVRGDRDGFVDWARRERENLKDAGKHKDFLIFQAGYCWHLIALLLRSLC